MRNMNEYNESYRSLSYTAEQKSQIAARAAAEAKAKAGQHKVRRNHHVLSKITAVAACLATVLTITAEAAGIPTPVSELLSPFFGGTVAQTEVIDKIGRPIDACDTDNGITISADAIIGDAYNACIVFTIRKNDGTPLLPEGVTAQQLLLGGVSEVSIARSGGAHGSSHFVDQVPGDHEIQYVYTISSDAPLNKGTCKVVFGDITQWDDTREEKMPVIEGDWKFRFEVDYEDSSITFGNGETFTQEDMEFTIQEVRVSPMAIQVSYEVDSEVQWSNAPSGRLPEEDRRQQERYMENVEILLTLKDGSVINMSNSGGSIRPDDGKTYCVKGSVLPAVIPLEELAGVSVGGVEFLIENIM